jgi:hypothetical protein
MRPKPPLVFAGLLVAAIAVGGLVVMAKRGVGSVHQAETYYCPMHPSYTSGRPGDCPICNMKLVKRAQQESVGNNPKSAIRNPQSTKDICYLHNCPKVHEGRPCPMLVVSKAGEKVTCPICGTHVVGGQEIKPRRILYWTDPMIPGYKSDKAGKSPMGMELVPVYEEGAEATASTPPPDGYAPVLLSPQKQQLIGVTTAPVTRQSLMKTIRTVGTVAHDPELYQAQAEYLQALKALTQAQTTGAQDVVDEAKRLLDSTQVRLKHLGLSEEMIQEMADWSEPQHSLLFAHPGEPVWVYARVYEYELPLLHPGQAVSAQAAALPGEAFSGTIRAIDPMVESTTRTTRVRIQLDDPAGHLRPDMYLQVVLTVDLGEMLVVPAEAVFDTGTRRVAFVDQGQGLFEPRDVIVGTTGDGYLEVKSGLAEGEPVVTSGNFLIDSESRLKAALEGMAPPPAASAEGGSAPDGAGPSGQRAGGGVGGGGHQHGQ